ncbi:MAG: tetratricopeptide repeat protein [Planctomycetes bacterium]|nr:tetratricopeptide repeat protein [Planctomycetota bacterium]
MARKRVNKNLVAFLTMMGIVLSVLVVGIATYKGTQRSPEVWAEAAREAEADGDREQAVQLYQKAYNVDQQVKYLIEASRCAYEIGEVGRSLGILQFASVQEPDDLPVLNAFLERLWQLHDYGRPQWRQMRDHADRILAVDPDHVGGLLCGALALDALKGQDTGYARRSKQAFQRALELGGSHTRLMLIRAQRKLRESDRLFAERPSGITSAAQARQVEALRNEAVEILSAGLEAHPNHSKLLRALARTLLFLGRTGEALDRLAAGVEARPDDPDLRVAFGRHLMFQYGRELSEKSPAELKEILEQARRHFAESVRLDPAMYEGYIRLGQLMLYEIDESADPDADRKRRYHAALAYLDQAVTATVGLRSIRAALQDRGRIELLGEAFETALRYARETTDPAQKAFAFEQADQFLQKSAARYKDSYRTHYMRGHLALARKDTRRAIQSFQLAEQKNDFDSRIKRLTYEQLSNVYYETKKEGLALQYVQNAIEAYQKEGLEVPLHRWLLKIDLLNRSGREQDAFDRIAVVRRDHPDNPVLIQLGAAALAQLGRQAEAAEWLAQLGDENANDKLMMQARMAARAEDYPEAERHLRQLLDDDPAYANALSDYVYVASLQIDLLEEQGDAAQAQAVRDQALALVRELSEKTDEAHLLRQYEVYVVRLSTSDPAERDAKLLEIIRATSDPTTRAAMLFKFHYDRQEYAEALPHLDTLEASRPDDPAVHEQQFYLALNQKDWDKAEKYVAMLTQSNFDFAGGSVFRGQLALSRKEVDAAVSEWKTAEDALPKDAGVKVRLAAAQLQLETPPYQEIIERLKLALELTPRDFNANKFMYAAYEALGRAPEGVPYLEQARQLKPDDPFVRSRAEFLDEETKPQEAIARREKVRAEQPDNIANLVRLGQLYAKTGNLSGADDCFRVAAAIDPSDRMLAQTVSRFYVRGVDPKTGEAILRQHLEAREGPEKIGAKLLLAAYYERLGEQAAARDAYVEAQRMVDTLVEDGPERRRARIVTGFQLADFYDRTELLKEMIEVCRRVLDQIDESSETQLAQRARLKIIRGMLRTRRIGDAEKELAAYSEAFPEEVTGLLLRAQLLELQDEREQARRYLTLALQKRPNNVWALYRRGSIHFDLQTYDQAREDLLRVKELAPLGFDLKPRLRLATLFRMQGQLGLAEAELRELLELRPVDVQIATSLLGLYRAAGQMEKAQRIASEYMARQPENPLWPRQLGRMYLEAEEFSVAARHLQTALERSPELQRPPALVSDWMWALTKSNRAAEALTAFQALGARVDPAIRVAAARAYWSLDQQVRAFAEFDQALRDGSQTRLSTTLYVAVTLSKDAPNREIVAHLQKLLDDAATSAAAKQRLRCALGSFLLDADAPEQALQAVAPVLATAGENTPEQIHALLTRAQAQHDLKNMDAMVAAYEQILLQDELNVAALNNLAYGLAADFDRPKLALKYAQQLRRLAPDNNHVQDTIGWVQFLNGNLREAERALEQSIMLDKNYVAVHLHIGELYIKQNRKAEAREALQAALELAREQEDDEGARRAQELLQRVP